MYNVIIHYLMKGELMRTADNNNKRKACTLLLTGKTLQLLKDYAYEKFGTTNMSKAVMSMAQEYEKQSKKNSK